MIETKSANSSKGSWKENMTVFEESNPTEDNDFCFLQMAARCEQVLTTAKAEVECHNEEGCRGAL